MRLRHTLSLVVGLLALSGRAWAGPVGANPASLTFPDTGVGATSAGQMVTFTNNGNAQVTVNNVIIAGTNPGDFSLDFGIFQPPFAIGPGVNFTVTVKFAPTLGGQRSGTLTAQLGGGVGDTTVPLTGKAIGQKLTVTPSPINAGGSKLNVTTTTQVTIQNAGGGNVIVSGITLSGANANEFTISGAPAFPATLGPGGAGKFSINLNFTPTFQGNNHVAQLNVANDDPNLKPSLVTQISGYGGDPKVATDIGTAAFGNLRVGLTSAPQVINVQNVGNSALKVSQVVLDAGQGGGGNPNDFVLDAKMIPNGTSIPAMGQLPISVSFKPSKTGQTSARVVIVSDDPNTPAKYISLLGNGTMAKGSAAPANIDFGMQSIYLASTAKSVTFTNAGDDSYFITKIDYSGANKDWFRTNGIVVFPVKVAPNASVKIDVIALPLGLGDGTGTVTFTTDDAMTPTFAVPLKVNGIGASVKMDPAYGDFGTVGVLGKKTINFTMKNTGTDVLKMEDFRFVDPMQCSCFQVNNAPQQDMNGDWPSLKPGETLMFSVLFSPQVAGMFNSQIEIDTSDPMARHVHIPLDGVGDTAGLRVDPVSYNFGTVLSGNQSTPQNITISNTGGAPLMGVTVTLSGANPNNFRFEDPGKFDLAGGQSKVVPVYYAPVAAGTHTANLVITPMGFAAAQVKLSGIAVTPVLQVATGQTPPTTLDFDMLGLDLLVGAQTDGQPVGIKVPANGIAVTIDRITIAGSPDFTIDQAVKADLSPGVQTTFNVYFKPSEADKTKTATASIFVKGVTNALATVQIKGTGTTPVVKVINNGCSVGSGRNVPGTLFALLALPALVLFARRRRNSAR